MRAGALDADGAEAEARDRDADELRVPSDQVLPPGRRDATGFWIPEGYEAPEDLFSPHQRRLQEKQRQAHRTRRQSRDGAHDDFDAGALVDSPESSD